MHTRTITVYAAVCTSLVYGHTADCQPHRYYHRPNLAPQRDSYMTQSINMHVSQDWYDNKTMTTDAIETTSPERVNILERL